MIRAVLVDDEALALKNLKYVLEQSEDIVVQEAVTNPLEALVKIGALKPDVVFLDIEMPGINGFAVAEEVLKIVPNILIVFVTAYDEYAVKAFEANAVDYVLKPVSPDRIRRTIEKIQKTCRLRNVSKAYADSIRNTGSMLGQTFNKITAWKNERIYLLNLNQVLYLTMIDGEAAVITEQEEYKVRETLNYWEEFLHDSGFIRCHKSFLVNIDKIRSICPMFNSTFSIKLNNYEMEIPVSRRYAGKFKQALNL